MLVGFKARNHAQQVAFRGADDTVDERITPHWIFRELDFRFRFTLDAAANARNAKCKRFHSIEDCGLRAPWFGERVWCNPPYSDLNAWVEKAWLELLSGCPLSVLMVPANRTEQPWWQRHVEPHRDSRGLIRTEFMAGRFNFGVPGNEEGKFKTTPPFGIVLLIYDALQPDHG